MGPGNRAASLSQARGITAQAPAPRRRMLRYEVGIDVPVTHCLTGSPVHVGAMACGSGVEFWAEHDEAEPERRRTFQVFGTGHVLPDGAWWAGTAPRTPAGLVWHLYEIEPADG
jgi:phosphate/sulfate permease